MNWDSVKGSSKGSLACCCDSGESEKGAEALQVGDI